jgi:hypothetical protein
MSAKNVENKTHAGRPRHRRKEIIEWSLKELSGRKRLWMGPINAVANTMMNLRVK